MRSHAKASSAGSIEGSGKSRGLFRRAFATRGASDNPKGSGARSGRTASLFAILATLSAVFAFSAASASAAPVTVMGAVTEIRGGSAHVSGEIDPGGPYAFYTFEYSTDEVNWSGFSTNNYVTDQKEKGMREVHEDLHNLKPATKYFVRLAGQWPPDATVSPAPNAEFETLPVGPPTVAIDNASQVSYTSALATGEVKRPSASNPDPALDSDPALDVNCTFEYISDAQYDQNEADSKPLFEGAAQVGCNHNPVTQNDPAQVKAELTNLIPGTTYHLRLVASNGSGTNVVVKEATNTFTTLVVDPPTVLSINDATGVISTVAKVSGSVKRPTPSNPDPAFNVNCVFEYISDAQYDQNEANSEPLFNGAGQAGCTPNPVTEKDPPEVKAELTNLTPGTTYHLRLVASNGSGTNTDAKEATNTFTTGPLATPTVSIDPVTTFTGTTAHFSGHVNPNGLDPQSATNWHFQCTPDCPGLQGTIAPTNASQVVEVEDDELVPDTDYQVELIASNGAGSDSEAAPSFHSPKMTPLVRTYPAFALGNGTEAQIGGTVAPSNSGPAEYWFEYGPGSGASYPTSIPATKDASADSGAQVFVTRTITGLSPETEYHFRLVAKNATGERQGDDLTFETPPSPGPVQSNCPNAKIRTETNSAALPECRAYELTTEPEKNGGDVWGAVTTSPDGNRVGYSSLASFGDTKANVLISNYVGQRGAAGWTTRAMQPPFGSPGAGIDASYYQMDYSSDLSAGVAAAVKGVAGETKAANVILQGLDGSSTWVTAPTIPGVQINFKAYEGRSADASRIFFRSYQQFLPGVPGGTARVWEWFDGKVSLVSKLDDGTPLEGMVGSGINGGTDFEFKGGALPQTTAVSADGSRVFFGSGSRLYVREDGLHTRLLSVSKRTGSVGQPASANFGVAAADGSIAYMGSGEQLTDDAPSGGGLYSYNLETNEMHFIGANAAVVKLSESGKRLYFTSPKLLVPGKGTKGASNLYTTNDEGGELAFIGTGEPGDFFFDTTEVSDSGRYVNATPDGSKFAFDSTARLTAYDNAGHKEIYLYDADEGSLRCVSCRPNGQPATGDAALRFAPNGGVSFGHPRALGADGSQVFFETQEALVPGDANGQRDVYEYRDGQVLLISSGTSPYPSQITDNSPDGKNVFFTTRDSLVGQDIDGGSRDIYDARVEGGFPPPPPPVALCEGEACQGQAHGAPAYTTPGTTSQGRGNPDSRKKNNSCAKKLNKQHSKCGKKTKKHKSKKHQTKKASKSGRGE